MTAIPATQSTSVMFAAWQQKVKGQIDDRLATLASLDQSLQANASMSDAQRQQLQTELSNEKTGLQALQTKVASDTNVSDLRADAHSMVVDYRVYRVEAPKVRLAERMANQEKQITNLQGKVDHQLASGEPSPNLANAQTELNAAQSALQSRADALLALTPQSYSPTMFNQYRDAVSSAKAYLAATRTDLAL